MADVSGDRSCTAARLFEIVWQTMADVIGSAATATLVHRSARRACDRSQLLAGVVVGRRGLDYRYTLPATWNQDDGDAVAALQELARELTPLLVELTGPVLIRRLSASDDLRRCRIVFPEPAE